MFAHLPQRTATTTAIKLGRHSPEGPRIDRERACRWALLGLSP
jgi:hypothetical protein